MTAPRPPSWRGAPPPPRRRIPEDLPFVVRRSTGKVALLYGAIYFMCWVLVTVQVAVSLLTDSPDSTGGDTVAAVAVGVCGLVVFGAMVAITVRLVVGNGPVLALDHAGLWVKNSTGMFARAVWLPWESVEQVRRRRVVIFRMLVVTAGGVRYLVPLRLNDRTDPEIVAAVDRFGGRSVVAP
ncbi:hypothetical protein AB0H83_38520 [Dactylosporangium sp. NPDC050688]|uniref:hypothetical protein n=1 Tax=Dactylosporangium sp. NPDC050688 TaxID=3157217 RepID=UPI003403A9F9